MTQLFEQMLSTVRRFLFVSKYVCMLFVLAAFYGACQVNYLDYALSYGGKLVVILAVSWHLGALLYKGFLTYQLGFVNPESKAVFITGCDSGFGPLHAKRLNEYGFTVFAGCLFPEGQGPKDLASSVKYPDKLILVKLDVCCDQSVKSAFELIRTSLNNNEQLWAVVNNAGIALPNEFEWCDIEDDFKRTFEVNLFGVVRVCKAAIPLLRESKGRIVNISSMASKDSVITLSSYSASKAAVTSLSRTLRRELRKFGINVICVEPFFYATGIIGYESTKKSVLRGWDGLPESIKSAYGFKYLNEVLCLMKANSHPKNMYTSTDTDEVARCVRTALTLNHPEQNYSLTNKFATSWLWFVNYMPSDMHEYFSYEIEFLLDFMNRMWGEGYGEKKMS